MSEGDIILTKMEYHTYRIDKEYNEQSQVKIKENEEDNKKLQTLIKEVQLKKEEIIKDSQNLQQQRIDLERNIEQIRSEDESKQHKLKDQLIQFEQRYTEQEKLNEISMTQQKFREPNRYFCDIQKCKDGKNELKVLFHQDFKIKKILTEIQQNSMNFIAYLENNDISHVIKQNLQTDSSSNQVIQGNELTLKIE